MIRQLTNLAARLRRGRAAAGSPNAVKLDNAGRDRNKTATRGLINEVGFPALDARR